MRSRICLLLIPAASLLCGCDGRVEEYVPASSISRNGFARDARAEREADGREVKLWGFVDPTIGC
jgi:hypothetical protein